MPFYSEYTKHRILFFCSCDFKALTVSRRLEEEGIKASRWGGGGGTKSLYNCSKSHCADLQVGQSRVEQNWQSKRIA